MTRTVRLLLGIVVAAALVAAPAAAAPSDLSRNPLDRAALLALPSVYRVDVTVELDALRRADGVLVPLPPRARTVTESGTAVAVAPNGWLVTAGHVGAPSEERIASQAYLLKRAVEGRPHTDELAREWVERTGATPVGARVAEREVRQADAGGGTRTSRLYEPTAVVRDPVADLALMRIPAPGAPSLGLDEGTSIGTRIVTIGFGRESLLHDSDRGELEPALRQGQLGRTGELAPPTRAAIQITAPVARGDSGGPAVDEAGRVRGIVVVRNDRGGIVETASSVRRLLEEAGVRAGPSRTEALFREAMERFWALDFEGAQAGFAETLGAFPAHTLAPHAARRAAVLEGADLRLVGIERRRATLLAVAALATLGALACAVGLARTRPAARGVPGPAPRRGGVR